MGIVLAKLLRECSDTIIGKAGTVNETGDVQAKLDIIANEEMAREMNTNRTLYCKLLLTCSAHVDYSI